MSAWAARHKACLPRPRNTHGGTGRIEHFLSRCGRQRRRGAYKPANKPPGRHCFALRGCRDLRRLDKRRVSIRLPEWRRQERLLSWAFPMPWQHAESLLPRRLLRRWLTNPRPGISPSRDASRSCRPPSPRESPRASGHLSFSYIQSIRLEFCLFLLASQSPWSSTATSYSSVRVTPICSIVTLMFSTPRGTRTFTFVPTVSPPNCQSRIATPCRVRSILSRVVKARAPEGHTVAHMGRLPMLVRS